MRSSTAESSVSEKLGAWNCGGAAETTERDQCCRGTIERELRVCKPDKIKKNCVKERSGTHHGLFGHFKF